MCGEIHPIHFHDSRSRIFDRYDDDGNPEIGKVPRMKCTTAKKAGNQYTLTILPAFLLPGCLVRADDVFESGMDTTIRSKITKVCGKIKALDERTAHKHLSRFDVCLNDRLARIAELITEYGGELPNSRPGAKCPLENRILLYKELASGFISVRERLFGFEKITLEDVAEFIHFFIHEVYPCSTIPKCNFSRPPPDDEFTNPG